MAIPKVMEGHDLRASAQTGTGKTAAFILPALNRLMTAAPSSRGRGPRILILVPTRELAMQVTEKAIAYSKYLPRTKTVCIYGGAPYPVQNRQLSQHYEVLVATPGRLIDHMERGRIDFSRLEMLVLDEADRMLDMGFIGPVEQIADATPKGRQTLLFSATLKGSVLKLSQRLLNEPQEICVHAERARHEGIDQRLLHVDNLNHKLRLLDHLLKEEGLSQTIVFTATKRHADQIVEILLEQGHRAAALHGDMNQRQRTRTMERMREGRIDVLVATDVAARGIDVQTIGQVINFDLPQSVEDYVHRIGRTGRAGAKGIALSFVAGKDNGLMRDIERFTGQKMTVQTIPGLEPTFKPQYSPAPRRPGSRPPFQNRGPRQNRAPNNGPGGNREQPFRRREGSFQKRVEHVEGRG
ncbi:MAG: DEAD/DEAH box helicase [Nitrosomonas sp.]|nr:MAG: DEAD/DEAH box helicase [Nitrosomonas sp.]